MGVGLVEAARPELVVSAIDSAGLSFSLDPS